MRILLLPSYFSPEDVASPYLSRNRNLRFADEGWNMVVYTPIPSRGISKELRKEYKKRIYRTELLMDGHLIVHRFPLVSEGKNPFIRAFRYFAQNLKQFNRAVLSKDARRCNVMLIASTPPTQGAMASMVKKIRHIPLVYNLQDIFPDSMVGTGMTREGSLLWRVGRHIEDFTYRNADKIIVISEEFKRNIMAKGVPEDKIVVIYNWVEEDAVVDVPRQDNILFLRYGLNPSKFYITYSGNIGLTQNMDLLLSVMEELQTEAPEVQLILIGEGAYKEQVIQKIGGIKGENGVIRGSIIPNVTMLPFQPYEDISYVFSLGNAGLVISKPGVGANSVPSKTWSIMSASRPILANFDENEIKDIIINHHCGIFTKAGDKEAFKASILKLYNNPDLCREYGNNGRKFILDNLTKEVGTQRYVDVIKSFEKSRS